MRPYLLMFLVFAALLGLSPGHVEAASPPIATPPRLGLIDGEVSFWRPGAQDWVPARLNTPLAAGDQLWTGADSRAEVQIGPSAFLRAAPLTQLGVDRVESDALQLGITTGTAALDLAALPKGRSIEVGTPNGAYSVRQPGYYRFDVDERATTLTTRRGGRVDVVLANGLAAALGPDERLVLAGTDAPTVQRDRAGAPDAWDRWNFDRSDDLLAAIESRRRVPPEVYGTADLDRYGSWRPSADYGEVWFPERVAPDWTPYSDGHWIYDPAYGWSWVDDAPWGWAPFHYGRWVNVDSRWAWAPGPPVQRPRYAPALVGWLGPAGAAGVGWVALGWGEPVVPWWGRHDFVGHPYWGGWGGPRFVNQRPIRDVDVRRLRVNDFRYSNLDIDRAVIVAPSDRFGRGDRDWRRLPREDVRRWRALDNEPQRLRPDASSLAPWAGRAQRPPERVLERPVVRTRAPDNSGERLRAIGLHAPEQSQRPAPLLVQPGPPVRLPAVRDEGRGIPTLLPSGRERGDGTARLAPPVPGVPRGPVGEDPHDAAAGRWQGFPNRGVPPEPGARGAVPTDTANTPAGGRGLDIPSGTPMPRRADPTPNGVPAQPGEMQGRASRREGVTGVPGLPTPQGVPPAPRERPAVPVPGTAGDDRAAQRSLLESRQRQVQQEAAVYERAQAQQQMEAQRGMLESRQRQAQQEALANEQRAAARAQAQQQAEQRGMLESRQRQAQQEAMANERAARAQAQQQAEQRGMLESRQRQVQQEAMANERAARAQAQQAAPRAVVPSQPQPQPQAPQQGNQPRKVLRGGDCSDGNCH